MKSLLLVWTALWRKPTATILTTAATATAYMLFGLMLGLYQMKSTMVDDAKMDQLFVNARYNNQYAGLPLSVGSQIERMDGVVAVGAFKTFVTQFRGPGDWIVMASPGMQRSRPDAPISPTQWELLFSMPSGVLVTRQLAKTWHLKVGDSFPVTAAREYGGANLTFQVLAILPEDPQWPNGIIWGNMSFLDNAPSSEWSGKGNIFWILIKDASRAVEICRAIDRRFANSATATYSIPVKANRLDMASSNINRLGMMLGVAGSGLLMILFLVANTVARSVRERMPEFAVLHTLGFRLWRLRGLVFMEAAFTCLSGAILGTFVAAVLTQVPSRLMSSNFQAILAPTLKPMVLVWAIASASLVAFFSAVIPLLKLKSASIAEVLAGR